MRNSNQLHDKTTTFATLASVIFAGFASTGIMPEVFGPLAAISYAINGYYTNK